MKQDKEQSRQHRKAVVLPRKVTGLDSHVLLRTWQLWAPSSLTLLSSACSLQVFTSEAYSFLNTPLTASSLEKVLCEEAVSQNNKENSVHSRFSSILMLPKDTPFYHQTQYREHTHVLNSNSKTFLFFLYFITF